MSATSRSDAGFPARLAWALRWQRWLYVAAFSALLPLTGVYNTFHDWTLHRYVGLLPWLLLFGVITLCVVALSEATSPPGPPSFGPCIAAVIAAALVAAALGAFFAGAIEQALDLPAPSVINQRSAATRPPPSVPLRFALFAGVNVLFYGLLVVLTYVRLQHVRLAERALSEAEIAREDAQGRLAASRLQAARERVDPRSVIATLGEIERGYDRNPASADAMLDELIAHLRESIPRLRSDRLARVVA